MQLRFAGADRDAEHVCGFLMRVTIDSVQHQHVSRALRQRFDRGFSRRWAAERHRARLSGSAPSSCCGRRHHFEMSAPATRQRSIDRDPVQPRAERTAALEAAEIAPGADEGLLRAVLGDVKARGSAAGTSHRPCPSTRGRAARRRRDRPPARARSTVPPCRSPAIPRSLRRSGLSPCIDTTSRVALAAPRANPK